MINGAEEYCDEPKDTRRYFAECAYCHEEIYRGESCYYLDGNHYHDYCFKDNAIEILEGMGAVHEIAGVD